MVDEVGSISEETATQAETVAAAAEEQASTLHTVADRIESLSSEAGDLRQRLDDFEVSDQKVGDGVDAGLGMETAADGGHSD